MGETREWKSGLILTNIYPSQEIFEIVLLPQNSLWSIAASQKTYLNKKRIL